MIVTIDTETTYSQDYSLSLSSTVEYVRDPRFQIILCAIKFDDAPTQVHVGHAAIADALAAIDWSQTWMLSHNNAFDGAIVAWHFGHEPRGYLDSLAMSRAVTAGHAGGSSLAKVARYLGLPAKGDAVVHAKGMRLEHFTPAELHEYGEYCIHDADLSYQIYQRLKPSIPKSEMRLIDSTVRMFVHPQVCLDEPKLVTHLAKVRADKAEIMQRAESRAWAFADAASTQLSLFEPDAATKSAIALKVFASNDKFPLLLESMGVEVPTKLSPTTGKPTYALAKGDRGFRELCDDPEQPDEVQVMLAARIGAKSTLEESRAINLLKLAQRPWPDGQTWCPIQLRFFGARTGRFSGDGGNNFQNIPRGSALRQAIRAPDGYRIVHRDSSQIEARMVAWMSGCQTLLLAFEDPARDVYCEFASQIYGRRVTKDKEDKGFRFVGKTSVLGLGYSCGALRFRNMLFIGNGGMSMSISPDEAERIVHLYHDLYPEIPQLWRLGDALLSIMLDMGKPNVLPGFETGLNPVMQRPAGPMPAIRHAPEALFLPNAMAIRYPNLRRLPEDPKTGQREIVYDTARGGAVKLYGGKFCENASQGLARIVITDIILKISEETGHRPFLSTHDSLDYVVREKEAEEFDARLAAAFAIRPSWAPGLPLDSEGGWGQTLADAEAGVNR